MNRWNLLLFVAALGLAAVGCSTDDDEVNDSSQGGSAKAEWDGTIRHAVMSASLEDDCVNITWSDTARVEIASNIYEKVAVDIRDGHVTILAAADVADEVSYTLSGYTTDGSVYMDGSYKCSFIMGGLTLTNPDSAAINIRDGKRIAVYLADGTVNTLTDGADGTHKACMMVKGHTEFSGSGTLILNGNTKHAFWGKEYVQLKASVGSIVVKKAVADGLNVNQFFQMNGGTLDISGVGDDGIEVSFKTDDEDNIIPLTDDEDNTSEILIKGGTIQVTTTIADSKCMKTEGNITINENKGTTSITLNNTGSSTSSGGMGGMGGKGGRPGEQQQTSGTTAASKGMRAEGDISIQAGTVTVTASSHEGVESKSDIDISGGILSVTAADDALNAGGNISISGGYVYAYSSSNDGIDANGNIYMTDGVAIAFGAGGAESGIDVDEQHTLNVSGGYLFGIGGRIDCRYGSMSQPYAYSTTSASYSGKYIILAQGATHICAFRIPTSSYSGIALVSTPEMTKGTSYTLGTATSVTGTETGGFILSPTVNSMTTKTTFTAR